MCHIIATCAAVGESGPTGFELEELLKRFQATQAEFARRGRDRSLSHDEKVAIARETRLRCNAHEYSLITNEINAAMVGTRSLSLDKIGHLLQALRRFEPVIGADGKHKTCGFYDSVEKLKQYEETVVVALSLGSFTLRGPVYRTLTSACSTFSSTEKQTSAAAVELDLSRRPQSQKIPRSHSFCGAVFLHSFKHNLVAII